MKHSLISLLLPLCSLLTLTTAFNGHKLLNYTEAFSSAFSPVRTSVQWTSADTDGTYISIDPATSSLLFVNIVTGERATFVDASKLGFQYDDYAIQPSRENVLFATNYRKQYRHSFFADYFIFNRASGKVVPLVADQKGDIQYAGWSTTGDVVAFVRGNDLYIWKDGEVERITSDGGENVFNGVPDWVYEEEIFGDRFTLWFSPDGEYVAFLRFDETGVKTYTVDYFMDEKNIAPPYPDELAIRYPKVGETNPTVSVHLLNVNTSQASAVQFSTFPKDDLVISEVAWVADEHENFIFRTMNRVQDKEALVLVDVATGGTKVIRERDGTDGWIDANLAINYVPGTGNYLDLSDHEGWRHLYLYPVQGGEPKALTSGEWEVTAINKIDAKRSTVYYTSTERDPTERHIYSVNIKTGKKTALVNTQQQGYWGASFSEGGGYYILSYNGPDVPHQELYSINFTTRSLQTLNDNAALKTKLAQYKLPQIKFSKLKHPSGYELNVREVFPAKFNPSKKYPVLFDPYGGPGSQEVNKVFYQPQWSTYIASDPELEYIIVTVDNRGTGYKGRAFRSLVTSHLGKLEAEDQIWVANQWKRKSYVDADKIAIWGWSYGGYLSAKVIEANSGAFSLGLITAPVSDWRFYDSLYTERYMKTYDMNPSGYDESAVRKPEGFKAVKGGFLIQHGTGDDNVHFQHAAVMADVLTRQGVGPAKMAVQWFTDSDHSIRFHGANGFLYKQLTERLWEEKRRGKNGRGEGHQWSRRRLLEKGVGREGWVEESG